MALRNKNGTPLSQSQFEALTTQVAAPEATYTVTEDVYEDFDLPGATETRGRRLKYRKGQVIPASKRAANYTTPTVPGALSPATGPAAGGTKVTITGTNLRDVTGVTFDGVAGTALRVVSATKVEVVTPAHAAGAVAVVVQSPAGNVTKSGAFTYA